MIKFFWFLLVITQTVKAQNSSSFAKASDKPIDDKWVRASIQLEARSSFLNSRIHSDWLKNGVPKDSAKRRKIQDDYRRDKWGRFTGIFLLYKNKHYIITARHCVIDPYAAIKYLAFDKFFLCANGSKVIKSKSSGLDTTNLIWYFDRLYDGKNSRYIVTDEKIDIGIIALDDIPIMGRQFVALLYDQGYSPIKLSDINQLPILKKGNSITVVGFPREISDIPEFRRNLDSSIYHWQSASVALPSVTKGVVEKFYSNSTFFTGNVFSYHGNSGGPVISGNKLVGIVTSIVRPIERMSADSESYYYTPAAYFSKSSFILPMLQALEKRFVPNTKPYVVMPNFRDSMSGVLQGMYIYVK